MTHLAIGVNPSKKKRGKGKRKGYFRPSHNPSKKSRSSGGSSGIFSTGLSMLGGLTGGLMIGRLIRKKDDPNPPSAVVKYGAPLALGALVLTLGSRFLGRNRARVIGLSSMVASGLIAVNDFVLKKTGGVPLMSEEQPVGTGTVTMINDGPDDGQAVAEDEPPVISEDEETSLQSMSADELPPTQ